MDETRIHFFEAEKGQPVLHSKITLTHLLAIRTKKADYLHTFSLIITVFDVRPIVLTLHLDSKHMPVKFTPQEHFLKQFIVGYSLTVFE